MSRREILRRDARRMELSLKPTLTPGEESELQCLEAWHARVWRRIPGQLAAARAKVASLQGLAAHFGIGPC